MSASSPTARRWMTPPPVYGAPQGATSTLQPYLTLPYLLSLTWLAYPILSLLFVGLRLQISSSAAQDGVADAKGNLLTSCKAAEQAAVAAASLPRFMAVSTNKQVADAVNGTLNGARATLVLALTIIEGIINFVIDIYRSTFLCFLELVVRGGLAILIGAVQEITSFIENTLSGLRSTIQNEVTSVNGAIQSAINAINAVNPFDDIQAPQFDIPSLSSLQDITLPTDFQDALVNLNSSLPTVDQLRDAIQDIIATPFEDLKAEINDTFGSLSFDGNTLPVPQQNSVSFCGQLDTSVVDDLGRDLLKAAQIGTIIIFVIIFLLLAGNCLLEWYKWRCLQQHLEYTRQAWLTDPTLQHGPAPAPREAPMMRMTNHNLLMLSASSSHPLLTRISNQISARLRLTRVQHVNLQWFLHYIFHAPALACFLIGFFGLLSVQLQLLAIGPLEAKYTQQVNSTVADFSNTIATSVNESMYAQSKAYADDVNGRVDTIQTTINDGMFGWVNATTTTLNDTLVNFYADIQNAVGTVFDGTILETPIQEFVRCIIGTKVEAVENALTFLHDNLVVNMPRVNDSVLVLSPADVSAATRPVSLAAVGGGEDNSEGLVGRLVNRYVDALKKERLMFAVFMFLWLFVVFIAICILLWHSYGRRVRDAYHRRKWRKKNGDGTFTMTVPYQVSQTVYSDEKGGGSAQALPSFTPVISPRPGGFFNLRNLSPQSKTQTDEQLRTIFGRNSDSLANPETQGGGVATTAVAGIKQGTRKLTAIGRKAMGRERFVSDEEKERAAAAAALGEPSSHDERSWLDRLTSAFRRHDDDDTVAHDNSNSVTRSRGISKPKLTVTTNIDFSRLRRDQLPTAVGDDGSPSFSRTPAARQPSSPSPNNPSGSRWSISPQQAPTLPWLPSAQQVAARKSAVEAFRSKPRRIVSVPLSVDSTYGPGMDAEPMPAVPAAAVTPARYPRARDSVLPDSHLAAAHQHRRSSSFPLLSLAVYGEGAQTRQIDPFKTPFDDDAAVLTSPTNGKGTPTSGNPFAPRAL